MSRWTQVAERNRAVVAQNAECVLADTNYDPLRGPRALLALAIADITATVAMLVCWLVWGSIFSTQTSSGRFSAGRKRFASRGAEGCSTLSLAPRRAPSPWLSVVNDNHSTRC